MTFLFLISSIIFQMGTVPFTNHRIVLIFGNNTTLVQRQLVLLQKDSSGLAERDLIVKQVKPGDNLYQTYDIIFNEPFTVILIGKDGGEKYRSANILTTNHLFTIIDAMPMRQAEIGRQKNEKR